MDSRDDDELIRAYLDGEDAAGDALVRRHRQSLYGFLMYMLDNEQNANDLFQEVWIRAIEALPRYRHRNRFRSWLFRIANNLVIDQSRRDRRDRSLEEEVADGMRLADRVPAETDSPDRGLDRAELSARIRETVDALPIEQREVFVLRTTAGISFREIARIQGTSVNTALGRMHYAVLKLRAAIGDDWGRRGRRVR